ncbi:exopolysaccharide biosynthesis protein [Paenibacillus sp. CAA11]|uniref:phosphodiester glycosidase family protein n=1 Tax=Paenibacillus sp. CAA11 TaxID=1532905 RepID=UPI000D38436B|nr:phosphodiester glycosidase family protein [Paenibacillus sp. CAA11]AWB43984.1 exopolysaccharide biosynthesis protein [Paenibacillus sp. CAA11]
MNLQVKQVNRFFLLATAPFFGLLLVLWISSSQLNWNSAAPKVVPDVDIKERTRMVTEGLSQAEQTAKQAVSSIRKTTALYMQTTKAMSDIVKTTAAQAARPETIYNKRITSKLGVPVEYVQSDNIRIELYKMNPGTYRGYAMKVKLKNPKAMKMVLGKDKLGGAETTLAAVKRHGAVAGINAGGFADAGGSRYPLSTTVMNGKYVVGFEPSYKDLSFVGISESGKLIGGKFYSKQDLDRYKPAFGASFVPVLLKNGSKTVIPDKWKQSPYRAPRTVIGNYKDDQLIILVVDGYNEGGTSGATLEELQNKMVNMGVVDAYNLDGGGSTSLILNGRVVNHPSDGALRPVPTHFLFYK